MGSAMGESWLKHRLHWVRSTETEGRKKPGSPLASGRLMFNWTPFRKKRLELVF